VTCGVLITAGGVGRRMGSAVPKQYLDLNGMPLLTRTIRIFDDHPLVDVIVLTVPQGDEESCKVRAVEPFGFKKIRAIVAGGATRQASVYNGLLELEDTEVVAIHDGVRPLVSPAVVAETITVARATGAALACVPVRETVKRKGATTLETVPRADLWLSHTPQTFLTTLILEAHRKALSEGFAGTDDASLVERLNHPVAIVRDLETNIKITTPEDLTLARVLLERTANF
jgi:2-C-methyl-D-erythritol 4-phosphate cytidylyltransferase